MALMLMNGHCKSFNGDGKTDLLVRHDDNGQLLVYPHSGTFDGLNTFLEPVLLSDDFSLMKHGLVRSIDIHGDGMASVLAVCEQGFNTDYEHGVYVYENKGGLNGRDTLGEWLRMSGKLGDGRLWETMGIADINGNGRDDTFGREKDKGHIDWFRNNGKVVENDTFDKTPRRMLTAEPTDFPLGMADVTGTGRLDLLILRENGDLCVYEFSADFDFNDNDDPGVGEAEGDTEGTWYTVDNLGADWNPLEDPIVITDIDLDGNPDLLIRQRDGVLVALQHRGTFDRENPADVFRAPVPVLKDLSEYYTIT